MKTILTIAVTGVMAAGSLTTFAQEHSKAVVARKDTEQAKKDFREAKMDSSLDYQNFKMEAEMKIKDNEKKIAALKAKKSSETKEVREKYDQKVLALDEKNNDLKKKIKESSSTKTTMWVEFKREFTQDMESLGHSIKDLGVDNSK